MSDEQQRQRQTLAIVVGAGGVGMAVARRLSQRHRILLVDLDGERAEIAAKVLRTEGGQASSFQCDITDQGQVAALAAHVTEQSGFRVLVNVAALSPSMGDFAAIVRVNLQGAAHVGEALLPLVQPGGAAIFISSMAAHLYRPPPAVLEALCFPTHSDLISRIAAGLPDEDLTSELAYPLSKHGLNMYCRRQATAWGASGARICSLSPGMIASPMGAIEFETNPHKRPLFAASPLKREGTLLEIADAIEFLASDRASFISGIDLLVDGGLSAALSDR